MPERMKKKGVRNRAVSVAAVPKSVWWCRPAAGV